MALGESRLFLICSQARAGLKRMFFDFGVCNACIRFTFFKTKIAPLVFMYFLHSRYLVFSPTTNALWWCLPYSLLSLVGDNTKRAKWLEADNDAGMLAFVTQVVYI